MKLLQLTKDILFPSFCLSCRREGVWLCPSCLDAVEIPGVFDCPVCHSPTDRGVRCEHCCDVGSIVQHIALTPYDEHAIIGQMIHALKYQFADEVSNSIDQLVERFFNTHRSLFRSVDCVCPVPLHRRRQAERGFNQAQVIAEMIGTQLDLPVEQWIVRHRPTKQQAQLDRAGRLENVHGAFSLKQNTDLSGKSVLLVDDVYTTGSTMQACAEVLSQAGARVLGFTIARG